MDFQIGQVFSGGYPEAAADWCNATQQGHIEEIDWKAGKPDAERRFLIVANAPYVETPEQTQARYTQAAQDALDVFARTRGYDGIMSACSYANSTDAQFLLEAEYCIILRDHTWRRAYAILAAVLAGTMEMPSVEAFLAMLPVSEACWPDVAVADAEQEAGDAEG